MNFAEFRLDFGFFDQRNESVSAYILKMNRFCFFRFFTLYTQKRWMEKPFYARKSREMLAKKKTVEKNRRFDKISQDFADCCCLRCCFDENNLFIEQQQPKLT